MTGRAGSADTDADYWLKIVSSFAPESPIIVVLNQIAKDPFELDETGLRQRFPNIRGEIDRALEGADIVAFLVSAALLASDYCNDVEMKRALERQAAGQCRIVPIIVRDAKWQLSTLSA